MAAVESEVHRTGVSVEEAAAKAKVSPATVRAHRAKRRATATPPRLTRSPKAPPKPLAAELPRGGAVSGRPDLLELLRRIGGARNAAAWAEVEEGLAVHVGGGEVALAPWLARPVVALSVDVDELDALSRGLDLAVEIVGRAEPGGAQLRALRELTSLGKSVATVKARRPPEPKPDEVHEAIRGQMDTAVGLLLRHTREAAAQLVRDRAAFAVDVLAGRLSPVDVVARVDAMLGGPPP